MAFRIDEFSDMPQAAGLDAAERTRFFSVGFGFSDLVDLSLVQKPLLLFGDRSQGRGYVAGGPTDDGTLIQCIIRTGALDQGAPRREKKYADFAIEQEGSTAQVVRVTGFENNEDSIIIARHIFPAPARTRKLVDVFLNRRVRNVSVQVLWFNHGGSGDEVKIYFGAVRYLFDEAVETIRWSSEEIDHGSPNWVVPVYAHISIRSVGVTQLVVIAHRQDGTQQSASYILPDTNDVKRKVFVPFRAMKGALIEYQFTAERTDGPFQLYRDESTIFVRPWGQAGLVPTKPVGDAVAVSSSEVANVRGVR